MCVGAYVGSVTSVLVLGWCVGNGIRVSGTVLVVALLHVLCASPVVLHVLCRHIPH